VRLGADATGSVSPAMQRERERVAAAVAEYAGQDHELVRLARAGIGYHHADVPEAVRQALEHAYRTGAVPILCGTSTLAQGVNLPTKTVIVSGTRFNQTEELQVRDFRNTAGRAGRPFRETEGHVILVAKTPSEARRLRRRYVDDPTLEPIFSIVVHLYAALVAARLGSWPSDARGVPSTLELSDPAQGKAVEWAEELDLQLLNVLAEEVVETDDEDLLRAAVADALGETFGAFQLGADAYPLDPLVRFAARRVRAVAARVPDAALRKVFVRTGLTLAGCETALAAARAVNFAIDADADLLTEARREELCGLLLRQAVTVAEVQRSASEERLSPAAVPALALDWMHGVGLDELRRRHGAAVGVTDAMRFAKALDRVVVHDLSWVLSAVLQLADHERDVPLPSHITAVSAMTKYGVDSEAACFAASIGIRSRRDALTIAGMFPTTFGTGFQHFTAWVSTLDARDVRDAVGEATAALFLDRAATLLTPREALELALTDEGTVLVPIRGIRPVGAATTVAAVSIGDELRLRREHDNPADHNAISVHNAAGAQLGYLAREVARVLAPLLDLEGGPTVAATLALWPDGDQDLDALERHDAVQARIVLTPA